MATASKTTKGFKVTCPFCGDADGESSITIDLNAIQRLACSACDEEFSPAEAVAKVSDQLKRWEAVARWVEMAGEALAGDSEA